MIFSVHSEDDRWNFQAVFMKQVIITSHFIEQRQGITQPSIFLLSTDQSQKCGKIKGRQHLATNTNIEKINL